MSLIACQGCTAYIDSDDDPDCFVEVGNMRRLHKEIVLCEKCREDRHEMEQDRDSRADWQIQRMEEENERRC